ncbi:MAG: TRAP transporter substrate-binding protein DctP [Dehalococcoidales bacterium]|nr:TRAP transporter substrate-binding protein DctP [Dehalococcoidales bacterium]
MKKIHWMVAILTVVLLASLLLGACAEPEPEPTPEPTPAPEPEPAPAPEPEPAPAPEPEPEPAPAPEPEPEPEPEARVIKFNYTMPPFSAVGVGFEWWADEFEARSNGRYVVETYGFSSLIEDEGSLDAVKAGVVEVNMTSTGSQMASFPLASVTGLPTLSFHKKGVAFEEFLASFDALQEFYQLPEIAAEFEDYHVIAPIEIDPGYLISANKEVFVPEDLEGLKVGGALGALADMMSAFGAAGVFQIPPQAYDNMQKGVTDAAIMTYAMIGPYNMFDLCDYILKQTFSAGTLLVLTSHEFYASLPPEDQALFDETWEEAMVVCAQGMYDETVHSTPAIEGSGIKINTPTAEQSALWDDAARTYAFPTWASMCHDMGISEETTDKIITTWQSLVEKYSTQ